MRETAEPGAEPGRAGGAQAVVVQMRVPPLPWGEVRSHIRFDPGWMEDETMRSLVIFVVAGTLLACDSDPGAPGAAPARYTRPDIIELLSEVDTTADTGLDVDSVRGMATSLWTQPAAQALWAGVKRAEERDLTELYGVEIFGIGEPGYDAVFFVRTAAGRAYCLLANDESQASRVEVDSVPAMPLETKAFEQLRRRVAVELPLPKKVDLFVDAYDGGLYILHLYRDGESHHAIWYEPQASWDRYRGMAENYVNCYPVASIVNALFAAVPAERLPTPRDRGWYDRTPGFPGEPR